MSAYGEYKHGLISNAEFRDRVRQEDYDARFDEEEELVKGNCERCIWHLKKKCYCEEGCDFQDINPEGIFKEEE